MKNKFDLSELLSAVQKYKISVAYLVPPIILAFAKHPLVDEFDLASLREIVSGAAPLSQDIAKQAADRLGCTLRQGYGMTELRFNLLC